MSMMGNGMAPIVLVLFHGQERCEAMARNGTHQNTNYFEFRKIAVIFFFLLKLVVSPILQQLCFKSAAP